MNEYTFTLQIEVMENKSERITSISKKQKSARVQQCGVANISATSTNDVAAVVSREIERTSDSIRRDPIDSLFELLEKGDHEGIIKLESDVILRAAVLEGTEPQQTSFVYFLIGRAFSSYRIIEHDSARESDSLSGMIFTLKQKRRNIIKETCM
jgi:hypothetical protein